MKLESKLTKRIELCTGCGACALICQHGAITIELTDTGFYTAFVDSDKCISCDLCEKVCIENEQDRNMPLLSAGTLYSAQSKDPYTLQTCTSGGISHELTLWALENEYIVSGVVYDYDSDRALSILVSDSEDLERIKGSKYLQSYTVDAYKKLIYSAKKDPDKRFLVFGTPCQIYGLSKVLKLISLRDRFILVDLFCHGVPSYLVWNSYLNSVKKSLKTDKVTKVLFRDKSKGWHSYFISISGNTGSNIRRSEQDLFYRAYFDNVLLSEACMDCRLRQESSLADIRLGDFWGKDYREREDGVSAVLLLSNAGKEFLNSAKSIEIMDKFKASDFLKNQSTRKYETVGIHKEAIDYLKVTEDLPHTIRFYRRKFPLKRRTHLYLKKLASCLPNGTYTKIRNIKNLF